MAGFEASLLELGDFSTRASKRSPGTLSKMQKKVRSISMGTLTAGKARYEQDNLSIMEEDDWFDQPSDCGPREGAVKGAGARAKDGKLVGKIPGKSEERALGAAVAGPPPGTREISTDERLDCFFVFQVC